MSPSDVPLTLPLSPPWRVLLRPRPELFAAADLEPTTDDRLDRAIAEVIAPTADLDPGANVVAKDVTA